MTLWTNINVNNKIKDFSLRATGPTGEQLETQVGAHYTFAVLLHKLGWIAVCEVLIAASMMLEVEFLKRPHRKTSR